MAIYIEFSHRKLLVTRGYQNVPQIFSHSFPVVFVMFSRSNPCFCWGSSHRWFCARSPGQHLYLQRQTHHGRTVGRMPLGCCRDGSDLVLFDIIMHTAHMLTFQVIIVIMLLMLRYNALMFSLLLHVCATLCLLWFRCTSLYQYFNVCYSLSLCLLFCVYTQTYIYI